jgi:hypothetical protein
MTASGMLFFCARRRERACAATLLGPLGRHGAHVFGQQEHLGLQRT